MPADGTNITWSDATLFGSPLPKRCSKCRWTKPASAFPTDNSRPAGLGYVCAECRCAPQRAGRPAQRARRRHAALGQKWCRHCKKWLPRADVGKNGLCRTGEAEEARARYASDPAHRFARVQHSTSRRRGIEPVPAIAREYLLEEFDGRCAYCTNAAETWDHIIAVRHGGKTVPSNVVPACRRCNSSKRDRDVWTWLETTERTPHDRLHDRVDLEHIHGAVMMPMHVRRTYQARPQ